MKINNIGRISCCEERREWILNTLYTLDINAVNGLRGSSVVADAGAEQSRREINCRWARPAPPRSAPPSLGIVFKFRYYNLSRCQTTPKIFPVEIRVSLRWQQGKALRG